MPSHSLELLRGTLDLLILRALSVQGTHGYGVARWIERATGDALQIEEGSLYPALYRLQERGWIDSDWGYSEMSFNERNAERSKVLRSSKKVFGVQDSRVPARLKRAAHR